MAYKVEQGQLRWVADAPRDGSDAQGHSGSALLAEQRAFQDSIAKQFEGVGEEVYAKMPPSVGWMFVQPCNFRCSYCFAVFDDLKGTYLSKADNLRLCAMLAKKFDKVTLLGGEPTICSYLHEMLQVAKAEGCTTSIITNGSRMVDEGYVQSLVGLLDWVTISIDSARPETHAALGRGAGPRGKAEEPVRTMSPEQYVEAARLVHKYGMRLKISTVVNALNRDEDMSAFILQLRPERWKLFQCLYIEGENSGRVEHLLISKGDMEAFVERHQHLTLLEAPVAMYSSTEETKNGYACITPAGCFLDDIDNKHRYSRPILDVGVDAAWADIDYRPENFRARGGFYQWGGQGATPCASLGGVPGPDIEDLAGANQARARARLERQLKGGAAVVAA